ncbi:MAG: hypothetical protein CVU95_03080 [Firmicutes bacterium HGW-Firmicutes-2]|nr:MAG: hypothetical protein CVU95_03080 [Firmicutes bacterium HGW-Firmicutes-2]
MLRPVYYFISCVIISLRTSAYLEGDQMNKETNDQMKELTMNRQRLSIYIYTFIYIVGLLGATGSIMSNPLSSSSVKVSQLLPVGIVISISLCLLYMLYRNIGKVSWIDTGIFLMTLILYFIIIAVSIGKILSLIIWIPMFVVFLFALMNIKLSYVFILIHLGITIIYNFRYPTYQYEVTRSTYVSMYTVLIILLITVPRVVNLFLEYQKKVIEDIDILNEKNVQVNLLLDENEVKNLQLTELAYHDSVTGLLNRQGFIHALDHKIETSFNDTFFILLIDIVQFRNINGVYGYDFGDKILITMAKMLNDSPLESDHNARVGNDSFAVVVKNIPISDLEKRINNDLISSVFIKEHGINIKYRIGIASCNQQDKTAVMLLNEADIALGKTKVLNSVHCYIYDHKLDGEIRDRFNMLLALENAIEKKHIVMVYQPIYDARIGEIIGFEALARWQDDLLGAISPDVFINLAEKSALIHDLGDLIIESVCQFAHRLAENGYNYDVNINISYRQLEMEDFAMKFLEKVKACNLDPNKIGIEITESVLIDNFNLVVSHLNKLRKEGIKIHLDDFGTGYSSLNYLDQLPIDILKIDKIFVDEILSNTRKRNMLETIATLAGQLNLTVLAEGVESQEQAELLVESNINMMQGYYFSKPVSEADLYQML